MHAVAFATDCVVRPDLAPYQKETTVADDEMPDIVAGPGRRLRMDCCGNSPPKNTRGLLLLGVTVVVVLAAAFVLHVIQG